MITNVGSVMRIDEDDEGIITIKVDDRRHPKSVRKYRLVVWVDENGKEAARFEPLDCNDTKAPEYEPGAFVSSRLEA